MTYEFVKHIADNLRFGSYDGKWEAFESFIKIRDINSNTYVLLSVASTYEYEDIPIKKGFKTHYQQKETPVFYITVHTGVNDGSTYITRNTWSINSNHDDYQFWSEFSTWVEAKWDDEVYKHKCLIEEVFVL
jgi:hypothetical protein